MSQFHLLLFAVAIAACGTSESPPTDPLVVDRPYGLHVPESYAGAATPLIVTLHGLGESGLQQATDSGLLDLAEERGFILAYPDGEPVFFGARGWNASCCDPTLDVDDVTYLKAVIADVERQYNVDPARVFITGYSNGAFMAYLMACEASDVVAAISVYAGTMIEGEEDQCQPTEPVAIQHTHGTADPSVSIDGGTLAGGGYSVPYLPAETVVGLWRSINDCGATLVQSTFDVDENITGTETTISRYEEGCQNEQSVELWSVDGGTHTPAVTDAYQNAVIDFLYTHSKR